MGLAFNGAAFKLKLIDLSDDTSVTSAGGTNTQTLQPPQGKIYHVIYWIYLANSPGGTANGTHQFAAYPQNIDDTINNIYIKSEHDSYLRINNNGFNMTGNTVAYPTSVNGGLTLQNNIWASYDQPWDFLYQNDTDVNQTGTRTLKFLVQEFNEMS